MFQYMCRRIYFRHQHAINHAKIYISVNLSKLYALTALMFLFFVIHYTITLHIRIFAVIVVYSLDP